MNPMISVVMAVYNTPEEMLRQAIDSILAQTCREFEFLIVLDCPTDGSDAIVYDYARRDSRIRVLPNEGNLGLAASLHAGVEAARGEYIARMDSDDISLPQRFAVQLEYMQSHPQTAVVGSWVLPFGVDMPQLETYQSDWIADQDYLKIRMLFRNVGVPHPTAMIRRRILVENGINYTKEFKKSQDYRLWVELMHWGDIVLLPQVLLRYRIHPGQISAQRSSQGEYARRVALGQITRLVGELTEEEKQLHFSHCEPQLPGGDKKAFYRYLRRISRANREKKLYDQKKLDTELALMWCKKAIRLASLEKDFRLLLSLPTLQLLRPRVFAHYRQNLAYRQAYLAQLQRIQNQEETP